MISLLYIPASHQIADILTKVVPRKTFDELNSKLGFLNIFQPSLRGSVEIRDFILETVVGRSGSGGRCSDLSGSSYALQWELMLLQRESRPFGQ